MEEYSRLIPLIGENALEKLQKSAVFVLGLGGVGGFAVEALARCGIGKIIICDNDSINESNLNRQIIALRSTIGKAKVDVMEERLRDINPSLIVEKHKIFFTREHLKLLKTADYVIDAIDTVTSKLDIIEYTYNNNIRCISSMGTGNKLDATKLKIADIKDTKYCPLARVIRQECKVRGIEKLKVVYSEESAKKISVEEKNGRHLPASAIFVPATAGLLLAYNVIEDLIK